MKNQHLRIKNSKALSEVEAELSHIQFIRTSEHLLEGIESQFDKHVLLLVINSLYLENKEVREMIQQYAELARMLDTREEYL